MFESDEEKLIYLAGCALTGTATTSSAEIGKLTRQAYGIAEEMLALVSKLKQSPEPSLSATASARITSSALAAATGVPAKGAANETTIPEPAKPAASKIEESKPAVKVVPASSVLKTAAARNAEKTVIVTPVADDNSVSAPAKPEKSHAEKPKPEELGRTHDKGWNYTPWGKN